MRYITLALIALISFLHFYIAWFDATVAFKSGLPQMIPSSLALALLNLSTQRA